MVAAIGAVAAVGGSMISANAAGNAADSQAQSAADATAQRDRAAAQMRQDLSPWVQQGGAANNALGYYLGLNPGGSGGAGGGARPEAQTYDQIRQELLKQYTTTTGGSSPRLRRDWSQQDIENAALTPQETADLNSAIFDPSKAEYLYTGRDASTTVDEARLEADIQSKLRSQQDAQAQYDAALAAAQGDSKYGSLLTPFRNGEEFDSGPAFSFTGEDLKNEPGYKFGLDQGTQGIERGQASRGNFLSGAAMKELTRFNEDYAGTKFDQGFNRASATYGTNLARRQNEWNTNLNAYNGNRDRIYNFLSGVSTLGQNSAAQTGSTGVGVANANANDTIGAGNAAAAAQVAGGNALQSGINGAANAYNSSQNLNSAGGWNQMLAGQSATSQNTGTNYLQSGYDALGMPNNI